MDEPMYEGSCLCGNVRYEVVGEITHVTHCHCSMCRKAHGAAFATYGSVRSEQHRFAEGGGLVRRYRSSEHAIRSFCANCGSPLLWHRSNVPEWVSFPLGSLNTPYIAASQRHIHVSSKAPWYEIHDPWPQEPEQ